MFIDNERLKVLIYNYVNYSTCYSKIRSFNLLLNLFVESTLKFFTKVEGTDIQQSKFLKCLNLAGKAVSVSWIFLINFTNQYGLVNSLLTLFFKMKFSNFLTFKSTFLACSQRIVMFTSWFTSWKFQLLTGPLSQFRSFCLHFATNAWEILWV